MMERMREESKKQFGLHKEKQSYERPKKKKKLVPCHNEFASGETSTSTYIIITNQLFHS